MILLKIGSVTKQPQRYVCSICEWVRLLSLLLEYIFYNVKWMRFFGRNCIVKWVIFFAIFCWLWGFLLVNMTIIIDKLQIWGFESSVFWSKIRFFRTVFRCFSQCNFKILCRWPTLVIHICRNMFCRWPTYLQSPPP